jgi:hypothetical protein
MFLRQTMRLPVAVEIILWDYGETESTKVTAEARDGTSSRSVVVDWHTSNLMLHPHGFHSRVL